MYLWKIKYTEKWNFILKYRFKKLFDVLCQFSLRKHSAKAASRGFFIQIGYCSRVSPRSKFYAIHGVLTSENKIYIISKWDSPVGWW